MIMHVNYIDESLAYLREQAEKWEWNNSPELEFVASCIQEKEILEFCKEKGNEKTKDIISTILKNSHNKYFKITKPMRFAIAKDILESHGMESIVIVLTHDFKLGGRK